MSAAITDRPFQNANIEALFNAYPLAVRQALLVLREVIFTTAEEHDDIGRIEEVLKWGCPSYISHSPKSGTTIRLSPSALSDNAIALSVHCQTTLVADFKELYPDQRYDKNRSLILDAHSDFPFHVAKNFIYLALTYHSRKKHGIGVFIV